MHNPAKISRGKKPRPTYDLKLASNIHPGGPVAKFLSGDRLHSQISTELTGTRLTYDLYYFRQRPETICVIVVEIFSCRRESEPKFETSQSERAPSKQASERARERERGYYDEILHFVSY